MKTTGGSFGRVSLLAWYQDRSNHVFLMMNDESNTWILKQRSNGRIVSRARVSRQIDPEIPYDVRLVFDGSNILAYIDDFGAPALTISAVAPATGTVGFLVKKTTGSFGFIEVN
jgi:hypothetical protein